MKLAFVRMVWVSVRIYFVLCKLFDETFKFTEHPNLQKYIPVLNRVRNKFQRAQ